MLNSGFDLQHGCFLLMFCSNHVLWAWDRRTGHGSQRYLMPTTPWWQRIIPRKNISHFFVHFGRGGMGLKQYSAHFVERVLNNTIMPSNRTVLSIVDIVRCHQCNINNASEYHITVTHVHCWVIVVVWLCYYDWILCIWINLLQITTALPFIDIFQSTRITRFTDLVELSTGRSSVLTLDCSMSFKNKTKMMLK